MVGRRSEVTNELIFETLMAMQSALAGLRKDVFEIKERMMIMWRRGKR